MNAFNANIKASSGFDEQIPNENVLNECPPYDICALVSPMQKETVRGWAFPIASTRFCSTVRACTLRSTMGFDP